MRNTDTGDSFECAAKISVDESDVVVSVGDPIAAGAVRTIEPFKHSRVVLHDYASAEKIFLHAVREVAGRRFFSPSPVMIVHPDMNLDDGLTQIEARALREIADGSGARKVIIHEGQQLTDQEAKSIANQG